MANSAETEALWGASDWGDADWGGGDLATTAGSTGAVVTLAVRMAGAATSANVSTATTSRIPEYALGSVLRLTATFTEAGAAANPTGVRFKIRPPLGDIVTLTYGTDAGFTNLSDGVYYYDYTPSIHGTFVWRAEGLTDGIAAGQQTFRIADSLFD